MEEKKKKGFFSSLFAPKSKGCCCCNVQFEEVPEKTEENKEENVCREGAESENADSKDE